MALALFFAIVVVAGCGESLPTLQGKITVNGQPPPPGEFRGQIAMMKVDGGPVADSKIMPDGSYSMKTASQPGLAAGMYKVAVTGMVGIPRPTLPGERDDGTQKWAPTKYATFDESGLTYEVKPGANEWSPDLQK